MHLFLHTQTFLCLPIGHTFRTVSSSPSSESLSGGRDHAMSSPPLSVSRGGRDSSTSSPPSSATRKDSFFNISRSRSHSKTINKKDAVGNLLDNILELSMLDATWMRFCIFAQEELEAQVSFLQGQINDLEAMSKYCAKMMNVHIGES